MNKVGRPRTKEYFPSDTGLRLIKMARDLKLSEKAMAEYLDVPFPTYRKWVTGERVPSKFVARYLDLLDTLESLSNQKP